MKRILSIDGGGIRGVFPAAFLADFEDDLDEPLYRYFDLIAGTSTGGIIAIGLAMGFSARQILNMYEEHGPAIFGQDSTGIELLLRKLWHKLRHIGFGPKYSTATLEAALSDILGDRKIGHAKTRLFIPAWNDASPENKLHIFKTAHHQRFSTDYKDLAKDAALATAAAPTYFREHITQNQVGLVDGGVWANNPTGLAVLEGVTTLGWQPEDVRVLSLGCLDEISKIPKRFGGAGFLLRGAIDLFMQGQNKGAMGVAHTLTGDVGGAGHKAIFRVSPAVPAKTYSLDSVGAMQSLKSIALEEARYKKPDLNPVFFQTTVTPFTPEHELNDE